MTDQMEVHWLICDRCLTTIDKEISGLEMTDKDFYTVTDVNGGFVVNNAYGDGVIRCSDENTAKHYCVLLNQAYELGFKHGYKQAKKPD